MDRTDRISRRLLATAFVSAALGVVAGAFGAHGLKNHVPPDMLETFETGARYQMYHAFALMVAGWASSHFPMRRGGIVLAAWCFILGTVLFSGTLYALSLTGLRWLGAITPLGGLTFIAGWMILAIVMLKKG